MKFWQPTKKSKMMSRENGQYVDRMDYEYLLSENRLLREPLTLDNFILMVSTLLEKLGFSEEEKITISLASINLKHLIKTLDENKIKEDRK